MKLRQVRNFVVLTLLLMVTFSAIQGLWIGNKVSSQLELEMESCNNLRQVMLGIEAYHAQYGRLPCHALYDLQKQPIHSWRTLITPYLAGTRQLYRWSEPWDGPFNQRLAQGFEVEVGVSENPVVAQGKPLVKAIDPEDGVLLIDYAWPFRRAGVMDESCRIHFFAVVGKETAWPEDGSIALDDIADGAENTLLLVESHSVSAYWSEPRDLRFDEMDFAINVQGGCGISGPAGREPLVLFADGEVYRLQPETSPEVVRALLTANGGEQVDRHQLLNEGLLR